MAPSLLLYAYILVSSCAFTPLLEAPYGHQQRKKTHLHSRDRRTSKSHLPPPMILFAAQDSKQLARELYKQNAMPPLEDELMSDTEISNTKHESASTNNLDPYDENKITPLESEFCSLMSSFLTYTQRDIRSLTSTSNRYLNYKPSENTDKIQIKRIQGHKRTKEAGIRYRALFDGVQR